MAQIYGHITICTRWWMLPTLYVYVAWLWVSRSKVSARTVGAIFNHGTYVKFEK